jgi:3',5'-cyclic AMP phosphodiesterase CpdA
MTDSAGSKKNRADAGIKAQKPESHHRTHKETPTMRDEDKPHDPSRRHALECMIWAGTGVLWTVSGGIPKSLSLLGAAEAAEVSQSAFTFMQISDSHVGFNKAANPHAIDTLKEGIGKIKALPVKPAFMIHTGDITQLSLASQFDDASQIIGEAGVETHYVPGEHDLIDDNNGKLYADRYGAGKHGSGWFSFDDHGVHFIGLVNVVNLKAGGLGNLGPDQLAWLADDLKDKSNSTPIVVFAHIPLWTVYADWGWGTDDGAQVLQMLRRFGSVTVLNGHIHQIIQKVEGNITFHTARSTAFLQPAPGKAPAPGPMKVPADQLRKVLGITRVDVRTGSQPLAIIDKTLADN